MTPAYPALSSITSCIKLPLEKGKGGRKIMCTNLTSNWIDQANDIFTVSCSVPSILLNILVLYIALRYVDFHTKLSQLYVVNMTASDLIYGIIYMFTKPWLACFPAWLCAIYYILLWSSQIGQVFFLLFLNIDKFISLSAPLHYNIYVTEKRVWCLWTTFWLIPLSHSLSAYFGPWLTTPMPDIPCKVRIHPIYYASTILVFFVVPLTISAMISVYIYLLAHKKSWPMQAGSVEERKKKHLKRVFFVFSSTLWSTITILPYRLAYCIHTFACVMPSSGGSSMDFPLNFTMPSENNGSLLFENVNSTLDELDRPVNSSSGGFLSAMCDSAEINILIYILFGLPPLGAVVNPIITIVTQRFYRIRAANLWMSCVKSCFRNRLPKCLASKCCMDGVGGEDRTNTYESSRSSINAKKSIAANKTSGVNVPLLVTCKENASGRDVVVEALTSSKAFQVL